MITITGEINYISESMGLLQHLAAGEKYANLREKLNKNYGNPFREGLKKFALLEQIEESARKALGRDMDEIRSYFTPFWENGMNCAGKAALLWEGAGYPQAKGISEIAHYLDGLSETEYCKKFSACLQSILSPLQTEETPAADEPFAVISCLMGLELADSDKWKLQKIFFGRKEHQERTLALLEKAALLLQGFSQELEALAEDFCHYWNTQFQDSSPSAYLAERLCLNIGENPLGLIVRPDFMHPNIGSFYTKLDDDGLYLHADLFWAGILFGEDFPLATGREQKDAGYGNYVSQVLKLLADKSKFEILSYIRDKEAYGSELAQRLGLTTATISHHMSALLNANLAEMKRMDKRIYYTSNQKALEEALEYIKAQLLS